MPKSLVLQRYSEVFLSNCTKILRNSKTVDSSWTKIRNFHSLKNKNDLKLCQSQCYETFVGHKKNKNNKYNFIYK